MVFLYVFISLMYLFLLIYFDAANNAARPRLFYIRPCALKNLLTCQPSDSLWRHHSNQSAKRGEAAGAQRRESATIRLDSFTAGSASNICGGGPLSPGCRQSRDNRRHLPPQQSGAKGKKRRRSRKRSCRSAPAVREKLVEVERRKVWRRHTGADACPATVTLAPGS